jgi:hypothetical protein
MTQSLAAGAERSASGREQWSAYSTPSASFCDPEHKLLHDELVYMSAPSITSIQTVRYCDANGSTLWNEPPGGWLLVPKLIFLEAVKSVCSRGNAHSSAERLCATALRVPLPFGFS